MIGILGIMLILGIVQQYTGVFGMVLVLNLKEDDKIEFLESKFEFLKDFSFDKETLSSNSELSRILNLLNKNGFKKGNVTSVDCALPHNEKNYQKVCHQFKSGSGHLLIKRST